jgi:hypothetical protein
MILIELTAAVDEFGTLQTFYVSDEPFQTSPTDSPADTAFDDTLIDAGSIGLHTYSAGRVGGATLLETGDIEIGNADGVYDHWINQSFGGQPVVIRQGEGGQYPVDFRTRLTGSIASVDATLDKIVVRIMDKAAILDRSVLTDVFAGTNAGPVGLEGGPDDIKGRVKPRVYGKVANISPPCVNTSMQVYRVSDRPVWAISQVYAGGGALGVGADYPTVTALIAATIAEGYFATCVAEGLFRLGSSPLGGVTADVQEDAEAFNMTAGEIVAQLAADAGLAVAAIAAEDIGELNAAAPYVVGLYLDGETSFREAMDMLVTSIGSWFAFDAVGVLRVGQLTAPSAEPVADILEDEILAGFERRVANGDGVPLWRVRVRYGRNWTVQNGDLVGSVDDARRAYLGEEYRVAAAEDVSVKIQFAKAQELVVDTLLADEADALAEAARLLSIHKVRRDIFSVPIPADMLPSGAGDLMDTLRLEHGRFGLSAGRNFRVLGRTPEFGNDRLILELWG